jgi:RNA polymerase sigma-70 factor (ECF subfamily)
MTSDDDKLAQSIDLVKRAQGGDQAALDDLIQRYYPKVRRIVRLRLGRGLRRWLDSEDILQGTFIGAVRTLDRFEMRDESSLLHWLGKIAEHQIKDAADYHYAQKRDGRRQQSLRVIPGGDSSDEFQIDLPGDETPPLEGVIDGEQLVAIEAAIPDLREEYREVILIRDYEGASWATVAELLSSPSPDAARMLYARAIAELTRLVRVQRESNNG